MSTLKNIWVNFFKMNRLKYPFLKKINFQRRFITNRFLSTEIEPPTKYLKIEDDALETSRQIAYKCYKGTSSINLLYIPGFMSNKSGVKALALSNFCCKNDFNFIRYDPTGLGESNTIALKDARFSHWLEDADRILNITDHPHVIVASSMGSWISLLLTMRYPEKILGLILIAPGVNFAKRYANQIRNSLSTNQIKKLDSGEAIDFDHPEYGSFPISHELIHDMMQYELPLDEGLPIDCPVRIIHGFQDADVPYSECLDIMKSLKTQDVTLTYIKDGGHRLCRDQDLKHIYQRLNELMHL